MDTVFVDECQQSHVFISLLYQTMNTENITRVRRLDVNTVLYSGSAYQSQGSSAAGHWITDNIHLDES